jgi:hypothetical protein
METVMKKQSFMKGLRATRDALIAVFASLAMAV